MLRRFEATARNLSLAFANLERANAPESLHFRQSLNLALRYGPRGDQFYAVASNPAPTENDISLSPCFVKVDTSMRAWTEACDSLEAELPLSSKPHCFIALHTGPVSAAVGSLLRKYGVAKEVVCAMGTGRQVEPGHTPAGIKLGMLRPEHAELVNGRWDFRYDGSLEMIREQLELGLGYGAYLDGEEAGAPVAWCFLARYGELGNQFVEPEHRGSGLGSHVMMNAAARLINDFDITPVIYFMRREGIEAIERNYQQYGLDFPTDISYIYHKPHGSSV